MDGRSWWNPQNARRCGGPHRKPTVPEVESQMTREARPVTAKPAQGMRAAPRRATAPTRAAKTETTARVKVAPAQKASAFRRAAKPTAGRATRARNAPIVKRGGGTGNSPGTGKPGARG